MKNVLSFFRKPKPTEISMTKLMELVALVKKLIDALGAARGEIASLKDALLAAEVQAAADDATIDELKKAIMGMFDAGGSTGGVIG